MAPSEIAARRAHRDSIVGADEIMMTCSHKPIIPLSGKTRTGATLPRLAAAHPLRHDRGNANKGRKQCGMAREAFG
jgi:hypothetical protein